ncbi:alpha/beta hydrolase [Nocardia sp. NEAU-G5]|uniref:Alpha/beta hydrolase n=1 Tax=Nocardia albiluteola TaxID=2842303 RepID=A0ABS6B5P9_9NOCA|nr:alpha/beta hydrolase [Nocardia albiluteola]MBU3062519.1 alpha/beta hydrolase [Nocardia albiluteola]MBU3065647.1 alpha/beta hydrolase [Nocardia albiluteola]
MPHFPAADGTMLAYEEYGTGPTLVFLAGWTLHTEMWENQLPYFADRGYRCVLMDRRGHGRSDRPATGYDADTRADDVAALLEHLDLTDVTLIGHSTGGAEAVHYLARHGQRRARGLVLLAAATPRLRWAEDYPMGVPAAALDRSIAELRADRAKWMVDRGHGYFATHLGNNVSAARIEQEIRRCLSATQFAAIRIQEAVFASDMRSKLPDITIPVLLLHGHADQSIPIDPTSRVAVGLFPNAESRLRRIGGKRGNGLVNRAGSRHSVEIPWKTLPLTGMHRSRAECGV